MNPLFIYLIISTLLHGFVFVIWSKSGWLNLLIKLVFFWITIAGALFALFESGVIKAAGG